MPRLRGDNWYVDVKPPGYPERIVKSTHQPDEQIALDYERTLSKLATGGRHDLLDAVLDGSVTMGALYAADVQGRLHELQVGDRPLRVAIKEFRAIETNHNARGGMDRLEAVAPTAARVSWLLQMPNMRKLVAHMRSEGLAASTERVYMAYVSKLVHVELGREAQRKAFDGLDLRTPQPRTRHLSLDEIHRLRDSDLWPMIALSLATGIRRGELLNLDIANIDFDGNVLHVFGTKSSKARRTVPVPDEVLALVRGWIALHNRTGSLYGFRGTSLQYRWELARDAAQLEGVVWHDLRRTFGVNCAREGVPLPDIQKWMGHSSIITTIKHYGQYAPNADRPEMTRAMQAMGFGNANVRQLRVAGP